MNDSKISVRYARALFGLAVEKKELERIFDDMKYISEICRIPEVKELIDNPVIVPSKKKQALRSVLRDKAHDLTLSLIDIVVGNGREKFIPAIAREFIRETKTYRGITESVLTTAVEINDNIRSRIRDLIENIFKTKVELKEEIDKNIIGGFILKVEDSYIDASVRKKLRTIEKELKGSALTT
ncbi:MAG TPA: ATP synthase F1 subunit delta [Bacteroidales bacterium]|nr:ATP synthase F1 subunit delta [Bacteroidales bacterium]HPF01585.1 ATP synthase F1 subunit delta [Bacteroidales bacterium]HPJ59316.1 ATP synthase F1 subunit delta [Bacteroidales bacterium]HPR13196.1 ATP synthase F1 subunit delta [Bacteroidales bacterium]HRW83937.1 ATP synthase F1 subunit delta [Bacteroidales bacterium]